ncbi:hypothetical protein ACF1CG_36925 [Streptomyces sp. NPDC014773]|uniref:hypothetical protein n=1 Tax=Streptomyces sp. NPDC014773 TaxID=3364908 RepID=UPI0036F4E55C
MSTPTTLYHFILTLQRQTGGGIEMATWSRTANVAPGKSRLEAYREIRAAVTADAPRWADAAVIFWSLEPDALRPPVAPWAPYVPPTEHPTGGPSAGDYLPQQRS